MLHARCFQNWVKLVTANLQVRVHDLMLVCFVSCFVSVQISKVRLKEVVEPDFMAELGYVQSVQANKNKEIKLNTKMNYTQIKYAPASPTQNCFELDTNPRA